MRKTSKYAWLFLAMLLAVAVIYIVSFNLRAQKEQKQYARPPHFDYQGTTYYHRGHHVHTLPEGFELVGEVTNIGNSEIRKELEGNVTGWAYASIDNTEVVYLCDEQWEEASDEEETYFCFEAEKEK